MIEKILQFSLSHRVLVAFLTAAISFYGLFCLSELPIDAVPDITNNQVAINITAPALSPGEMEKQVTYPVETALAGIPGLVHTRSISRNGFSQVTAVFDDEVDLYFARAQVGERLSNVREDLPAGTEPHMGAVSTGLGEIYMWAVEYENPDAAFRTPDGETLSSSFEKIMYLRTVQDWIIRPQLKTVEGVAEIDAIGGYARQYHIQPDPRKLAALGLTFADVTDALESGNASVGAGYVEEGGEAYVVRADAWLSSMDDIRDVVLASRNGVSIRIADIAEVGYGKELRTGSASENGQEVVVGTAMMLKGANSRTVARAVDEKLTEVNKTLPDGIRAKPVLNRTKLVDATIRTVQKNLAEGAVLVIAVLFLLLGNVRAAVIAALVIPVTMLVTAAGMLKMGISANLMSLGALDFGLIVDGAVIVTENCLRRLAVRQKAEGRLLTVQERLHEVMAASRQMVQPAVFGQAIIITVYVPLLTFSGVEGKMFEPMAMTVIVALAAAFVLSLTFVPAMVALLVKGRVEEHDNRFMAFARWHYAPILDWSLANGRVVIAGAILFFALTLALGTQLGREFTPTLDEKDVAMHAMRIPSTSLSQSTGMQLAVERAVSALPEVAFVFSKTGTAEMAADPMPPNVSDTFIILKTKEEWPDPSMSKTAFVEKLESVVSKIPGNAYEFTQPIQMRFNELISGVRSDIAIKIFGDDFDVLNGTAAKMAAILQKIPGASDVKIEQTSGLPAVDIALNKAAMGRLGLKSADVLDLVSVAIGGRQVGLIFEGDRRFPMVVRLPENLRNDLSFLKTMPVPLPMSGDGEQRFVPLGQIASIGLSEGPNQIGRENGKRRVVIQANVRGRDIASFVADAQKAIAGSIDTPPGYWIEWGGQFENLQTAGRRLMLVIPACFCLIFMMLFAALGSARHALLVFSGVPLAVSGGVLALFLRGMPLSVSAAVGFIALSGIAVLNGLVMVSYIDDLRRGGTSVTDAVRDGALTRLRPVLMTALVAALGFVPMALATGTGAEVQRPIATVVIGGLITATFLTLAALPALYKIFAGKVSHTEA